jgi:hypothetical protein
MKTKLSIALRDLSGANSLCDDKETPIIYRLLAFSTKCEPATNGQLLATSSTSFFKNIVLGFGVYAVAIEAVDALGATSRVCSASFDNQNIMSYSILSSLLQNSKNILNTDPDTAILLASNTVMS